MEQQQQEQHQLTEDEGKVAIFYQTALNEQGMEDRYTQNPNAVLTGWLSPVLSLIEETVAAFQKETLGTTTTTTTTDQGLPSSSNSSSSWLLGQFPARFGISLFLGTPGASPDYCDSHHVLCQLSQGGIGLPDRDYYFDPDKAELRSKYKTHIAEMLQLLHKDMMDRQRQQQQPSDSSAAPPDFEQQAQDIYALEEALAKAHMTKTENRDPQATYHKMSIAEWTAMSQNGGGTEDSILSEGSTTDRKQTFDWAAYLQSATKGKELGDINVRNVAALQGVTCVWSTMVTPELLRSYLLWHCIRSLSPYLPKGYVEANFDFFERTLSGTAEMKPRWKRAMAFTESALGEVLGQVYCAKYFDESCKERALSIVKAVRDALAARLKEVDWMKADSTRQAALTKIGSFAVKIGYPNEWIDYSKLQFKKITSDSEGSGSEDEYYGLVQMVCEARAFEYQRTVDEMNAPTKRKKWFMTPQTVNAYYHPSLNEIVFPAAILQPPFFDPNADDAVNYGSMAAVCGHEMTHGFDDKGRKFNAQGNMVDWWTPDDAAEYEKRVDVMVQQANAYTVHGQAVQGKLTCGENIADLGGLRLALRALMSLPDFDNTVLIDGFTPIQRFFLGWAQCWRQNVTPERALQLLTMDPHGPNEMRCNGPLSNMIEFHQAFGVAEESPMYRPLEQRVDIW